jgi:hypothetical protein
MSIHSPINNQQKQVMKKAILYVACILIVVSATAAAPGSKLLQSFSQTFPNAQSITWRDDTNGYFVSFTQNGDYNKAFYNKDGEFVYSLKYYNGDKLPTNIIMTLNDKFKQAKILGVTEVTTQNKTVYDVKLSKEGKLYCLDILSDGTIAKQESFINDNAN